MKAADIPYDVKRQMLSQLQKQLGSTEYERMIDAFGEDGLLDVALAKLDQESKSSSTKGSKVRDLLWALAALAGLVVVIWAVYAIFGQKVAETLFFIIGAAWFVLYVLAHLLGLWSMFADWLKRLGP